jgi:hypothetical protein
LDEHVVGLALLERPAEAVARQVDDDELRVSGAQVLGAEAQSRGSTRSEVPHEHAGLLGEPSDRVPAFLGLEVDRVDSLPRLSQTKWAPYRRRRGRSRARSPRPSGRSTLITRAPRSARLRVASGVATACSIDTTVISSSGSMV